MAEYAIYGGIKGKNRLEILSHAVGATTDRFLDANQDALGGRCLDLGCGNGQVTLNIAKRIRGRGEAHGYDMDRLSIEYARDVAADQNVENVTFDCLDVSDLNEKPGCNVVYARFLLSHLSHPERLLERIYSGLVPGGRVLIEDTDFSGHFCYPRCKEFERYVELYQNLLHQKGADANIGQRLPQLLKEAGFQNITLQTAQPVHMNGDGKLMAELTMEGISAALIAEQIVTQEEIDRIIYAIRIFRENEDSLMSLPRIIQVSAVRP